MRVPVVCLALLSITAPVFAAGQGTIEETDDAIIVEYSGEAAAGEKPIPATKAAPGTLVPATPSRAPAAAPEPTSPGTEPPADGPTPADGAASTTDGDQAAASIAPTAPVRPRDLGRRQRPSRQRPASSGEDSGDSSDQR